MSTQHPPPPQYKCDDHYNTFMSVAGIYAETFRYSSYIFVGDADVGEMSFSASTPDFSTLTRRHKGKKQSQEESDNKDAVKGHGTDPDITETSLTSGPSVDTEDASGVVESDTGRTGQDRETKLSGTQETAGARLKIPSVIGRGESEGSESDLLSGLDVSRDSAFSEVDDVENMQPKGNSKPTKLYNCNDVGHNVLTSVLVKSNKPQDWYV